MPKGDGKSDGLSKGTAERIASDHVEQGRKERQKAQNGPPGEVEVETQVGRKGGQSGDNAPDVTLGADKPVDGKPTDGGRVAGSFKARR